MTTINMNGHQPRITEVYRDYAPRVNVAQSVGVLLEYVPPHLLSHLGEIVLTNASGLPRDRRRQRAEGGSPLPKVRGLYYASGKNEPARIELFVDNILPHWPHVVLQMPFFRHFAVGEVLYHELGHHIQALKLNTEKVGHKEVFAERCEAKLFQIYFWKRYWYLKPLIWPLRLLRWLLRRKEE